MKNQLPAQFVSVHWDVIHSLVRLSLEASTLNEVIQEMLLATTSERQGRTIDMDQNASMEVKTARIFLGSALYIKQNL